MIIDSAIYIHSSMTSKAREKSTEIPEMTYVLIKAHSHMKKKILKKIILKIIK